MKRLWISASIFIIMLVLSIFSTMYIKANNTAMIELLDEVSREYNTEEKNSLNKLRGYWKDISEKYSIFVNQEKLIEIEVLLDELDAIWEFDSSYAVALKIADVRSRLEAIVNEQIPNIYNIL